MGKLSEQPLVRFLTRFFALALVLPVFLPLENFSVDSNEALKSEMQAPQWVAGTFIFLAAAWVAAQAAQLLQHRTVIRTAWQRLLSLGSAYTKYAPIAASLFLFSMLWLTSWRVFNYRPHLVDTIIQLFQAKMFAIGQISVPLNLPVGFVASQHMVIDNGSWYGQYPPGHSLLLALGVLVGQPWLINVVLSVLTVLVLYLFTRRIYGRTEATLLALLFCLCPFFLFMGASHMNHVPMLFFAAVFLYAFSSWEMQPTHKMAVLGGIAMGGGFIIRPLTAVAFGTIYAVIILRRIVAEKRFSHLLSWGLSFALVAAVVFVFNWKTTGSPLLFGYIKLWGENHGLGFHKTPWGDVHTPAVGLVNQALNFALLNKYLFEWSFPALLLPAALFWLPRDKEHWDLRLFYSMLAVAAAYFFYWHRDSFLGPRFLYVTLAFVMPLIARTCVVAVSASKGLTVGKSGLLKPVPLKTIIVSFMAAGAVYTVTIGMPFMWHIYQSSLASMKRDLRAEARAAGIDRGVVFIKVSWGNRLISTLRELGAPAWVVQEAYTTVDHCELQHLADKASSGEISTEQLINEMVINIEKKLPIVKVRINEDPTLRLSSIKPISMRCREQLAYDQSGFINFTPHLSDNDPLLRGPLIFVRDLRDRNQELKKLFPGMPAFVYQPDGFSRLN